VKLDSAKPAAPTWKLARLVDGIPGVEVVGGGGTVISGLAYDSRRVSPGALFFALAGEKTDGRLHVEEAVRRGAAAVLCEGALPSQRTLPLVQARNARRAMGDVAAKYYGHPSRQLRVIGITGTNGKTSTAFMLQEMLRVAGRPAGLISTIQYRFGGRQITAARTTPESPDIQQMLAEALRAGERGMVMEVSSQGLMAERLQGTHFGGAIFTNLSMDHLDYHGTMEAYFDAKKRLFSMLTDDAPGAPAVVNYDDAYGRRLCLEEGLQDRLVSYGLSAEATVRAVDMDFGVSHSNFRLVAPWGESIVRLPLVGRLNIYNALAALGMGEALGLPLESMVEALERMSPVPGRLEVVPDPRGGRRLLVDYAHTEDALRNVLETLRELTTGRLLCVFGCGGNRDRGKRPRMGRVVAELCDRAFVTSDNPRGEDPQAIIEDILTGMDSARSWVVEPDRAKAIRLALRDAREGDTVLVAGKGHETYQEIGGRMIHFDDREVVQKVLDEESESASSG
jgi:UDP-N-acetylmuramoyl-L-alanyl-D-glutamate--2,6-diaminopimelate ligase